MFDFAHLRERLNLSSQLPPMHRGETLVSAATLGDTQALWCSVLLFLKYCVNFTSNFFRKHGVSVRSVSFTHLLLQATDMEIETMSALQAQFPKEDEQPQPSPPRMALPGPTWPLDSHPDNVREFVAKHMKSPAQPTAPDPAAGGSDNSAYDRIMKQFVKMDDQEIGIRFDLVSKHPLLPKYIKEVRGSSSFGELGKCEEIVRFQVWLEGQNDPAPAALALPQPVRGPPAELDPEMEQKLQEMGWVRPEKKRHVEEVAPVQPPQAPQPKVVPALVQTPQPKVAAVSAQAPQPKVAAVSALPPKVQQYAAPAKGIVALTPENLAAVAKTGPADLQPTAGQYGRRAAANLISRLANNPARLEGMPELAKMVNDPAKKSELITMICDSNGSLEEVGVQLRIVEENHRHEYHRKMAHRWTKKEMEDHYGSEAQKVMDFKRQHGMVEDDENCPGGELFLISKKEDMFEDQRSTGISAAY